MINKIRIFTSNIWIKNIQKFARVKFPLPDLGQKIKQGTVKKLYVKEGDKIQQFQKIADVQSDKQFTEITAPEVGRIAKIYYQQTQVCKVGDLFLEIQTDLNVNISAEVHKQNKPVPGQEKNHEKAATPESPLQPVLASPVVLNFAKTRQVDITKVKGSGRKGRILKQDIIYYLQAKEKDKDKAVLPISQQKSKPPSKIYQSKKIAMNSFQKGMQKTMTEANKIPHLYLHESIDVTELDAIREKFKLSGLRVTMMGLLTKTFSIALSSHPKFNSTYRVDEDQFSYKIHDSHNISVAIDTQNGLVVPNIKNVQNLSILQIQNKLTELKKLSDSARLTRENLQGGTICLSNIGTIAGISACPIILTPQVCIVALGKTVDTPTFVGSSIIRKKIITMSYGCDHRIVDGGSIARFSNEWKSILENPYLAIAKLK